MKSSDIEAMFCCAALWGKCPEPDNKPYVCERKHGCKRTFIGYAARMANYKQTMECDGTCKGCNGN
jgi:hypothetical protein